MVIQLGVPTFRIFIYWRKLLPQNLSLCYLNWPLVCVYALCYAIWDLSTVSVPCMMSWIIRCYCQICLFFVAKLNEIYKKQFALKVSFSLVSPKLGSISFSDNVSGHTDYRWYQLLCHFPVWILRPRVARNCEYRKICYNLPELFVPPFFPVGSGDKSITCTTFNRVCPCPFQFDGRMDDWFTSFSTVFPSYQDNGRMIMKGCVQWNPVACNGWEDFLPVWRRELIVWYYIKSKQE